MGLQTAAALPQNKFEIDMKHGMWRAAQVRTNREFSVSAALRGKGYETFVPAYLRVREWSDRKKSSEWPLIAGYVFFRTALDGAQALVVSTPGVLRMVGFGGRIASIEDIEIERVRTVANSSLRMEPWPYIKQNSQVRITRGSLAGIQGTVLKVSESTVLVVSIDMLQRSVAVHIDRSWVEPERD
jgi:transcription antitermination factor NusG